MTIHPKARPTVRTLVLIICLAPLLWYGLSQLRYNLRAPLVIDVRATGCYLSPGGTYMYVSHNEFDDDEDFYIYKTSSGEKVLVPFPESYIGGEIVWVDDDILFVSYMWGEEISSYRYPIPDNGWVFNISTGNTIDTLKLDPTERQRIFERATERINKERENREYPVLSPDGKYGYKSILITDMNTEEILNVVPMIENSSCRAGWRPDSSGYYFIDRPTMTFFPRPGPIRLLLTHPPVP